MTIHPHQLPDNVYWDLYNHDRRLNDEVLTVTKEEDAVKITSGKIETILEPGLSLEGRLYAYFYSLLVF